jgi:hypothetical protein
MDSSIKEFKGDKSVKSVVLNDGTEIDADMVIIGIGIDPATDLIKGTDIETDKFGGLLCDLLLEISSHSLTGLLVIESELNIGLLPKIKDLMLHSTCLVNMFLMEGSPSSGLDTTISPSKQLVMLLLLMKLS